MDRTEDIILRYSHRGMTDLRGYLPPDYCRRAAQAILSWPRGTVLLTTGFYVAGHAETDGPAGTLVLARALEKLGFTPVVVTDGYCRGFFEPEGLETVYMDPDAGAEAYQRLLDCRAPVGLISVERCGLNVEDDYANMRGVSIKAHSARVDLLFDLARGTIPTVGVGDGGNEIGMGNLRGPIREKLALTPCHGGQLGGLRPGCLSGKAVGEKAAAVLRRNSGVPAPDGGHGQRGRGLRKARHDRGRLRPGGGGGNCGEPAGEQRGVRQDSQQKH